MSEFGFEKQFETVLFQYDGAECVLTCGSLPCCSFIPELFIRSFIPEAISAHFIKQLLTCICDLNHQVLLAPAVAQLVLRDFQHSAQPRDNHGIIIRIT